MLAVTGSAQVTLGAAVSGSGRHLLQQQVTVPVTVTGFVAGWPTTGLAGINSADDFVKFVSAKASLPTFGAACVPSAPAAQRRRV